MPVNFTIPAPRTYQIADPAGQITREWLNYLARDLPRVLGGIGSITTLPEIHAEAEAAQAAADAAQGAADAAALAAAAAQGTADDAQTAADDAQAAADAAQADVDALEAVLLAKYATRYDQDADPPTFAYLGEAVPGSLTSAAAWRIQYLAFGVDGDVTVTWADGDQDFDNIWDDRASLTYS